MLHHQNQNLKTLIVIVGPTAVGKTEFCVRLAKKLGTEVVSADSRQFYKELSIGTAKPTEKEMDGVPHHLVGNLSIQQDYSVADFEKDALEAISNIFEQNDFAILTGGSGLFIKAVCEGLDEMPKLQPEVRESLMAEFSENGLKNLLQELKEKDAEYFEKVDQQNHVRVIRALEVIRSSGKSFSSFRKGNPAKRPFKIVKIGLTRERQNLYGRINLRMRLMLEQDLFGEAKSVYQFREKNALQTVGYKEIFAFIDGEYDRERMVELLKQNSRRYAKRQLTWFRKDLEISWLHPTEFDKALAIIQND
ncbi:MAG: tRNA dimethylallyltransferase [Arenicella sp.]